MIGRCSLCGSRLNNGKCEFCGLNNKMYDREYIRNPYHMPAADTDTGTQKSASTHHSRPARQTHGMPAGKGMTETRRQRNTFSAGPPGQYGYSRTNNADSKVKKYRTVTLIIIFIIIICMFVPALIQFGRTVLESGASADGSSWLSGIDDIFSDDSDVSRNYGGYEPYVSWDSYDDGYDPYASVTREITETGSAYETTIGSGIYQDGVHIPEGIYRVELAEAGGDLQITDTENFIYESIWFGEEAEYDEVTEAEDVRLYNGAQISISGGAVLTFVTSNAQPLIQEPSANPLTGPVILDEGTYIVGDGVIPEGIYDVVPEASDGYISFDLELIYPNGSSDYLWSSQDGDSSEGSIRNVILPAGTEITYSGDPVELVPSEGYFEVDYAEYPWN